MSIFLDFDGTITAKDTIGHLAQFALDYQKSRGTDLEEQWAQVVKAYIEAYKACVDGHHTPIEQRTSPDQEVEFLRQMKPTELASLDRTRRCGVFRGIQPETFREAGRRLVEDGGIQLRPGFHDFVRRRTAAGHKVWVLSVNWSAAFIEGACSPSPVEVIANSVRPDDGSVVGPELLQSLHGGGKSEPRRALTNSMDKLDAMKAALEAERPGSTASIYMGDSITDIECILAADQGIVMSDSPNSTLLETLRRVGKDVKHISEKDSSSKLSWASSFDEIMKHAT